MLVVTFCADDTASQGFAFFPLKICEETENEKAARRNKRARGRAELCVSTREKKMVDVGVREREGEKKQDVS